MMTPAKTSGGRYRFEIDWSRTLGIRIDRSSETKSKREHNALVALLYQLRENGQLDVLRAFAGGRISIVQLKQAKRAGRLKSDTMLADVALYEPLWAAIDRILPTLGKAPKTRLRYYTSLRKLRLVAAPWLPTSALVRDLATVPWREVREAWTVEKTRRAVTGRGKAARAEGYVTETAHASAADWNHLRRAISTFLSQLLGDKYHPTRRAIVTRIEIEAEVPRKPRIKDVFWQIIDRVPEHARPCYVVLGVSGMRIGEYLYDEITLRPETFEIVTHGKTGTHTYSVAPEYWPWIELGVPSPLRELWLRKYFTRAAAALGRPELWPRDLRHLYAQMAKSEGSATTDTMGALGQKTPGITRGYEAEDAKAEVAAKVARGLTKRRTG